MNGMNIVWCEFVWFMEWWMMNDEWWTMNDERLIVRSRFIAWWMMNDRFIARWNTWLWMMNDERWMMIDEWWMI